LRPTLNGIYPVSIVAVGTGKRRLWRLVRLAKAFRIDFGLPFALVQDNALFPYEQSPASGQFNFRWHDIGKLRAQPSGIPGEFDRFLFPFFLKIVITDLSIRSDVLVAVACRQYLDAAGR